MALLLLRVLLLSIRELLSLAFTLLVSLGRQLTCPGSNGWQLCMVPKGRNYWQPIPSAVQAHVADHPGDGCCISPCHCELVNVVYYLGGVLASDYLPGPGC